MGMQHWELSGLHLHPSEAGGQEVKHVCVCWCGGEGQRHAIQQG